MLSKGHTFENNLRYKEPSKPEKPYYYTNTLGDKYYIKNIKTSATVGYAPPVWKRAQVQGLKESRLTIRGDGDDQGIVSSKEVWTRSVI